MTHDMVQFAGSGIDRPLMHQGDATIVKPEEAAHEHQQLDPQRIG
jgi:hypothetical protein